MDLEDFSPGILCAGNRDDLESHLEKGFFSRPDLPRWPVELPINWATNPFKDNNWRFLLSSWRIQDAWIVRYFKSGDPDLLKPVLDIALDWQRFYSSEGKVTQWTWYDMAAGIRAIRLAFLMQAIEAGKIKNSEEATLATMVEEHIEFLLQEETFTMSNHGIFQAVGLKCLAPYACDPQACHDFSNQKIEELFDLSFTKEGIHKENSPSYHRFIRMTFNKLRPAFGDEKRFMRILRLAKSAEPWLALPNGNALAFGSTGNDEKLDILETVSESDRVLVSGKYIGVKDFHRSGYISCRSLPEDSNDFMLAMIGTNFIKTHKHSDDLGFIYYSKGEVIFVDPGKFSYDYNNLRYYFTSAAAHNTVSLSDEIIQRDDDLLPNGSSLKRIKINKNDVRFFGSIIRPNKFSQDRTIVFKPNKLLIVTDVLNSENCRNYISSLHLHPDTTCERIGELIRIRTQKGQELTAAAPGSDISILRGQKKPHCGWYSPEYNKAVPTFVLQAIKSGTDTTITWEVRHNEQV